MAGPEQIAKLGLDDSEFTRGISRASGQWDQLGRKIEQRGGPIGKIASELGFIATPAGAAAAAVAGFGVAVVAATNASVQWETELANIQKTAGEHTNVDALGDSLLRLSTVPGMPVKEELSAIAENAGMLGIDGTQNVLQFTEAVAHASTAFGMTAGEAASQMAKMSNVFSIPISEAENLASAIDFVGNNMAATEAETMAAMQKMSGMGAMYGMAASEAAALSGSLIALGMNADSAGTLTSTLMSKITNPAAWEKAGNLIGMTAEEFGNLATTDVDEALLEIAEALEAIEDPMERAQALADLKLGEEATKPLLKMVGHTEDIRDNMEGAADAYEDATGAASTFEAKAGTSAATIQSITSQVGVIAVKFGDLVNHSEAFQGALGDISGALGFVIDNMDTIVGAMSHLYEDAKKVAEALSFLDEIMEFTDWANQKWNIGENIWGGIEEYAGTAGIKSAEEYIDSFQETFSAEDFSELELAFDELKTAFSEGLIDESEFTELSQKLPDLIKESGPAVTAAFSEVNAEAGDLGGVSYQDAFYAKIDEIPPYVEETMGEVTEDMEDAGTEGGKSYSKAWIDEAESYLKGFEIGAVTGTGEVRWGSLTTQADDYIVDSEGNLVRKKSLGKSEISGEAINWEDVYGYQQMRAPEITGFYETKEWVDGFLERTGEVYYNIQDPLTGLTASFKDVDELLYVLQDTFGATEAQSIALADSILNSASMAYYAGNSLQSYIDDLEDAKTAVGVLDSELEALEEEFTLIDKVISGTELKAEWVKTLPIEVQNASEDILDALYSISQGDPFKDTDGLSAILANLDIDSEAGAAIAENITTAWEGVLDAVASGEMDYEDYNIINQYLDYLASQEDVDQGAIEEIRTFLADLLPLDEATREAIGKLEFGADISSLSDELSDAFGELISDADISRVAYNIASLGDEMRDGVETALSIVEEALANPENINIELFYDALDFLIDADVISSIVADNVSRGFTEGVELADIDIPLPSDAFERVGQTAVMYVTSMGDEELTTAWMEYFTDAMPSDVELAQAMIDAVDISETLDIPPPSDAFERTGQMAVMYVSSMGNEELEAEWFKYFTDAMPSDAELAQAMIDEVKPAFDAAEAGLWGWGGGGGAKAVWAEQNEDILKYAPTQTVKNEVLAFVEWANTSGNQDLISSIGYLFGDYGGEVKSIAYDSIIEAFAESPDEESQALANYLLAIVNDGFAKASRDMAETTPWYEAESTGIPDWFSSFGAWQESAEDMFYESYIGPSKYYAGHGMGAISEEQMLLVDADTSQADEKADTLVAKVDNTYTITVNADTELATKAVEELIGLIEEPATKHVKIVYSQSWGGSGISSASLSSSVASNWSAPDTSGWSWASHADGGIFSSSHRAIIGDASTPEVVAPLGDLLPMIREAVGGGGGINITSPLLVIQGNVTSDVMPEIESKIEDVKQYIAELYYNRNKGI